VHAFNCSRHERPVPIGITVVDTSKYTPEYIAQRNAKIKAALAKFRPGSENYSYDVGLPTQPVGHASGIATAMFITSEYRRVHRPKSMNVTPEQVIDALVGGGVRNWVLMGLYGYVGYLAQPRATQDVDVLIAPEEEAAAIAAIKTTWPTLEMRRYEVVLRFFDPGEIAIDGQAKHVLDLMLPSNGCHTAILSQYHVVDPVTLHRLPVMEAAIASKYAALVSPNRAWPRKQQDAVDLRNIIAPNQATIDRELLEKLGELVFPGGGAELLEFLQLAIDEKPFPV
jgi:hypothetical protein